MVFMKGLLIAIIALMIIGGAYYAGIEKGKITGEQAGISTGYNDGYAKGKSDGIAEGEYGKISYEEYNKLVDDYNRLREQPTVYYQIAPTYQPRTVTCDSYTWLSGNTSTTCR
jgi:hypothetical protein